MIDSLTVQKILTSLRYYHGSINGNLSNAEFRAALKKFQADKGLSVDGWYGNECDTALSKYTQALNTAGITLEDMRLWRITSYYITDQKDYSAGNIPFVDCNFKPITTGSADYFCDSALEGTTKTSTGLILNVDAMKALPTPNNSWDAVLACSKRSSQIIINTAEYHKMLLGQYPAL